MKTSIYLLLIIVDFLSCNQSDQNNENGKDSTKTNESVYVPEIVQTSDKTMKPDFFIINASSTTDLKEAVEQVKNLKSENHPAGYLWIPDYESLSNKEMYSVFVGPFSDMDTCIKYLQVYKKTKADAYAVKVQHNKERIVIKNKFDIRVNDVRQFLILTYSTPEDEEQYAKDGGEDWAWFTNDVQTYFKTNYPNKVIFGSVYNSWLSPSDINQIKKEVQAEGFGYVLVNGNVKLFLSHNLPNAIIEGACGYFGLEYIDNSQNQTGD